MHHKIPKFQTKGRHTNSGIDLLSQCELEPYLCAKITSIVHSTNQTWINLHLPPSTPFAVLMVCSYLLSNGMEYVLVRYTFFVKSQHLWMLWFDEKSVSNGGYKIYKSETNLNFDFLSWRHFSYWDKHESSNSRSSSNKPEIKKK